MSKAYLTTFQAAEILSVTPDSVLKWIKSGILDARRTPGGHYRISRKNIDLLLIKSKKRTFSKDTQLNYCWEFNLQNDNCAEICVDCLVYKTRARRCYEMSDFPAEFGVLKQFCKSSCDDCEYYRLTNSNN
jgi:excisionase family DNA binding protein